MITAISVPDENNLKNVYLSDLREVNYIYGSNGSGKTTLSRIIAGESKNSQCSVTSSTGTNYEVFVYNRDFFERNFREHIPGVYTLGEETQDILDRIEETNRKIYNLEEKNRRLRRTLQGDEQINGKEQELENV